MENSDVIYRRILLLLGMIFILSAVLMLQLFRIQVGGWVSYTRNAVAQRQCQLVNTPLQPCFFDRNFQTIRGPVAVDYLLVINGKDLKRAIRKIQASFPPGLLKEYQHNRRRPYWIFSKPLTRHQTDIIRKNVSSNLQLVKGWSTSDRDNPLAWHILGQAGSGLEGTYRQLLRSNRQSHQIFSVVDGMQKSIPGIGFRIKNPRNATGLVLTLDLQIQKIVEQVMDREKFAGAVVILNVQTGEILAMASRPMVNLHRLNESLTSKELPFLDRAVSAYPPGSIFKLVILSAGLDCGKLTPDQLFFDPGYYQIGSQKWLCTSSSGHGHQQITLKDALAYSCNTVFIETAIHLGAQTILAYADRFGLGMPCNVGLRNESWGELPAGVGLSPGEQANLALGQQNVSATPLQIAGLIQTIANNGIRKKPYLVKGYLDEYRHFINLTSEKTEYVLKSSTAAVVRDMMSAVTQYGTGTEAQLEVGSAGKTGTAQIGNEEIMQDHAWFAGYAPSQNPHYAAVVFCEKGISGGKTAAPIFKEIMERVTKSIH